MPHVVILYTGNLEPDADMGGLCRKLADTMLTVRAEDGSQVFPTGGVRVFAYPAPHYAVADGGAAGIAAGGDGDYGFIYLKNRSLAPAAEAYMLEVRALEAEILAKEAALAKRFGVD